MSAKQAINDKWQGSVATCLRCGGVVNNQIKKGLLLSLWVKNLFFLNQWIFGKDTSNNVVVSSLCALSQHKMEKVYETITFLACNFATTGSFQSHRHLKECNKPSLGWKSFAIHKLEWWHFRCGRQVGYSLLSSEVCMNNTVENDFWISQSKLATSDRWGGQIFKKMFMSNFLRI